MKLGTIITALITGFVIFAGTEPVEARTYWDLGNLGDCYIPPHYNYYIDDGPICNRNCRGNCYYNQDSRFPYNRYEYDRYYGPPLYRMRRDPSLRRQSKYQRYDTFPRFGNRYRYYRYGDRRYGQYNRDRYHYRNYRPNQGYGNRGYRGGSNRGRSRR